MTGDPGVLLMRMVRGGWERSAVGTWLAHCYCQVLLGQVPVGRMEHGEMDAFPTLVARNAVAQLFREGGFDLLFMVDHDMLPHPDFFAEALRFHAGHREPCLLGSPYRTGPPDRAVEVVHELPFGSGHYERAGPGVAARRDGNRRVAGIGFGLVAINRAAFDAVEPPCFDYEFKDAAKTKLAWGEDMYFCRKLTAGGGKVFCAWDHWSAHAKTELVGKPEPEPEPEPTPHAAPLAALPTRD